MREKHSPISHPICRVGGSFSVEALILSRWIALVDSLKQLSRLVQLEGRMPSNPKAIGTASKLFLLL